MTQALQTVGSQILADDWSYDPEAEIVAGHLDQRAMERKVMLGCALVGSIGVAILLLVLAGSSSNLTSASPFQV